MTSALLKDLFGVTKPVIAMVHLPALPGRPRHGRRAGMRAITDTVAADIAALQDAGVDGLRFCNEADLPYQLGVGAEAVAAMAAVIGAYRSGIGAASVALFTNITPEFASPLGHRTVAQRARNAAFLGADALLVSGAITGEPTDLAQLREAKAAAPGTPVLANTGVTADSVAQVLAVADGVIVGTSLKAGGVTWNPVDPPRAAAFMTAARPAREGVVKV